MPDSDVDERHLSLLRPSNTLSTLGSQWFSLCLKSVNVFIMVLWAEVKDYWIQNRYEVLDLNITLRDYFDRYCACVSEGQFFFRISVFNDENGHIWILIIVKKKSSALFSIFLHAQRIWRCCVFPQVFRSLVDRVGLGSLVPVEYFGNKNFEFLPDNKTIQRFEVCTFLFVFVLTFSSFKPAGWITKNVLKHLLVK